MAVVQCEIQMQEKELTVGSLFALDCKGDWPKMNAQESELRLDQEFQYTLKLLKMDFVSPTEAKLWVTSYEVGEHTIKAAQLVDKENSVVLGDHQGGDLRFVVASVQDPQKPVQEPIGPLGPLKIAISPVYWATALALIFAFILMAVVRIYQKKKIQKQLRSMNLDSYVQSPLQQFYSSLRQIQRKSPLSTGKALKLEERVEYVLQLDDLVKLYLARKFLIPTRFWSAQQILKSIEKKNDFLYLDVGDDLKKFLAESKKSVSKDSRKGTLQDKDCVQLADMSRKLVEKIEKYSETRV